MEQPVISVRCSSPKYENGIYSVDADFKADRPDQKLFGMNVRFFYDSGMMTFKEFAGFAPGYVKFSPNPPYVNKGNAASGVAFGFSAPATFVNGAVQLMNKDIAPALPVDGWTKLFQLHFTIPPDKVGAFYPPIVWCMDKANQNGLLRIPPIVIVVSNNELNEQGFVMDSWYAIEKVEEQFNWIYNDTLNPAGHTEPINGITI